MQIQCSMEEYRAHEEENDGCCLACGEWSFGGVEPDASNYECENCGEEQVEGIMNLLMDGSLVITE
jgi:hypothetical protein